MVCPYIASERQMRVELTELVGDQVQVPLVFPCNNTKGEEVKMATMAHLPHLWGAIKNNLDQNEDESRITNLKTMNIYYPYFQHKQTHLA